MVSVTSSVSYLDDAVPDTYALAEGLGCRVKGRVGGDKEKDVGGV